MHRCLHDIDVVVLAGGLGTRLRSVLADRPKILAPVGSCTFLDILLDRLAAFGAARVIFALGHLAEQVEAHLAAHSHAGMTIIPVIEREPQGTAGALRLAHAEVGGRTALVMNGDSLVDADLCAFLAAHRANGAEATILCTRVPDAGRYGTVDIDARGRIVAFREKTARGAGTINAGTYLIERTLLDRLSGASLERDVFQRLPAGTLAAYSGDFDFIDIGTPEDLARAADFVARGA